jgi:hypothetical protein
MSSRRRRLGRPHSQAQNRSLSCCRRPSIGRRHQEQFGWIAMIIAMVGAFGGGAAVLALGSTDTTGTPAATTRVRRRRMTNQMKSQMRSRWQPVHHTRVRL